jgi:hypothetical protein
MKLLVGLLNAAGLVFWLGLMLLLDAAGGGRPWNPTVLLSYCGPLAYFALNLVSVLRPARRFMAVLGIAANLALLPYLWTYLLHSGPWLREGLVMSLPFPVLTGLWWLAYRKSAQAVPPPGNTGQPA